MSRPDRNRTKTEQNTDIYHRRVHSAAYCSRAAPVLRTAPPTNASLMRNNSYYNIRRDLRDLKKSVFTRFRENVPRINDIPLQLSPHWRWRDASRRSPQSEIIYFFFHWFSVLSCKMLKIYIIVLIKITLTLKIENWYNINNNNSIYLYVYRFQWKN